MRLIIYHLLLLCTGIEFVMAQLRLDDYFFRQLVAYYKTGFLGMAQDWCSICLPLCRNPDMAVPEREWDFTFLQVRGFLNDFRMETSRTGVSWDASHCPSICSEGFKGGLAGIMDMLISQFPPPGYTLTDVEYALQSLFNAAEDPTRNPFQCTDSGLGAPRRGPPRPPRDWEKRLPEGVRVRLKRCADERIQSPENRGKQSTKLTVAVKISCYVETMLIEDKNAAHRKQHDVPLIPVPGKSDGGGRGGGSDEDPKNWLKEAQEQVSRLERMVQPHIPSNKMQQVYQWAGCLQSCLGRAGLSTLLTMQDAYQNCIASKPQSCHDLSKVFPSVNLKEIGQKVISQSGQQIKETSEKHGPLAAAALFVMLIMAGVLAAALVLV